MCSCGGGGNSTQPPPPPPPPPPITLPGPPASVGDLHQGFIYQIVTDRFFNGDNTNDNPAQSAALSDTSQSDWHKYWGGDLAGIQQKLAYLKGMGVAAIWISPPVDNINVGVPDSGFHGFWARDMKRIEEHFGDAGNSWTAFDNLVTAAHQQKIRVIVDFAANHSNPRTGGEFGALYDNGTLVSTYAADTAGIFHHTPNITDYNDRYQVQYNTLLDLADLDQENAQVDQYLKAAVLQFVQHGVDGFRFDAVKHANWGWQYSEVNAIANAVPSTAAMSPFLYGEWPFAVNDPLYQDAWRFESRSGMSLLDFGTNGVLRDNFTIGRPFYDLDAALAVENVNFAQPLDLVTFVDSHDIPRLLSLKNDTGNLDRAVALLMSMRGIPVLYYGDEQYLHNDTSGGGDPYNRNAMSSFDTSAAGYKLVGALAAFRAGNPAVAYGSTKQRWISNDVYIFERVFGANIALVAVNKGTADVSVGGLLTSLPAGTYSDFLNGYLSGTSITVTGSGANAPVNTFTLPKQSVSLWQSVPVSQVARIADVFPDVANPGAIVTLSGIGFGSSGTLSVGGQIASVQKWTDTTITFTVPNVASGPQGVSVAGGTFNVAAFGILTVLSAPQVPVRFTVNGVPLVAGDSVYLTGNTLEIGNQSLVPGLAVGPMLCPAPPACFLNVSVPAGASLQFKFFKISSSGATTQESGANHTFTVPSSGVGSVSVGWQP